MGSKTATLAGAAPFDGRLFALGDARRAFRATASGLINAVGAVAFVGVTLVLVTLAAAWIVRIGLVSNPQIYTPVHTGPGTLALDYDATGAASPPAPRAAARTITEFYARYVVDVPKSRVALSAPSRLAPVSVGRTGRVPLPPARPAIPQKQAELVPAPEPKLATIVPPAPAPQPKASTAMDPSAGARTAVYDIAAATVFMPDGHKLEAHSGLYDKMDDPRFIKVRMRGPTPPNVYDLSLREKLFHGVRAIRLNPLDEAKMHGRDGMLAHTYMLGPNGQSNGCVSFKDYDKFLQAFLDGKVDRLVVVPELGNTPWRVAAQQGGTRNSSPRRYAASLSRYDDEPAATGALGYAAPERGAGNF